MRPETKRNEALGFIRGGLDDFSISRSSITLGRAAAVGPGHVAYVWFDALVNYLTAVGYGTDDERFAAWWPAPPRHRQGHPAVPLRVLAGDAAGRRARAARST